MLNCCQGCRWGLQIDELGQPQRGSTEEATLGRASLGHPAGDAARSTEKSPCSPVRSLPRPAGAETATGRAEGLQREKLAPGSKMEPDGSQCRARNSEGRGGSHLRPQGSGLFQVLRAAWRAESNPVLRLRTLTSCRVQGSAQAAVWVWGRIPRKCRCHTTRNLHGARSPQQCSAHNFKLPLGGGVHRHTYSVLRSTSTWIGN